MFIGHFAVGLASKRLAPQTNLAWLLAAPLFLDMLWPIFLLLGIEHASLVPNAPTPFLVLGLDHYPWSHSLVMAVVWGLALVAVARSRRVIAPAWLLVVLVVSHWVLDVASHAPDLPLWPGSSPRFGLGLWNSIPLTLLIEGTLWIVAVVVYVKGRPERSQGRVAFWSLVAITTLMWATSPWSPPPPSTRALGWFALIGWIIVPWAALADRSAARTSRA